MARKITSVLFPKLPSHSAMGGCPCFSYTTHLLKEPCVVSGEWPNLYFEHFV